jgi:hypothetical protein
MRLVQRSLSCCFLALTLSLCSWQTALGENVTYSYDRHHRVIAAEYADGLHIEYEYDLTGNLIFMRSNAPEEESSAVLFHWAAESVPQPSVLSDIGNAVISATGKYSANAQLVSGMTGNAIQQTGEHQYYSFPIGDMALDKGIIRMYVKHITPPGPDSNKYRYFFRTTNGSTANGMYAYAYNDYLFFYVYDSAGTWHRTFGQATWAVDTWYLYEFIWDADTGELTIRRDGENLFQAFTANWSAALPSFAGQNMFIGNVYPVGYFDEISIIRQEGP